MITISREKVADFCRRYHVVKLAFFGSILRQDFRPDSDVDILIEFELEHIPGLFGLSAIERELSQLLGDVKVDVRTPEDLSEYFRQEVLKQAEVIYARK